MSAIAGIVQFDGAPIPPGRLEAMTAAMASRGPDGIAHWQSGPAALGHCLLRTTPENLDAKQPHDDAAAGLVLVMDGRVDNREELRRELVGRGAHLRDASDAELVLRAYETWGDACPERIIGEFAFFIWDAARRCLFGARDAAGTRHFHYHAGPRWFAFASEIKGLLALGHIEPTLNESRLLDFLVVEYDRDDQIGTFYDEISRLPAGHAMRVTARGVATWRYWDPAHLPALRFASLDECAEAFREQLRIAVQCRLESIGPVGAMLSGGLDSSSLVALISKEFRDKLRQPLRTYSLIREDRENCPDWHGIRAMLRDGWLEPHVITSDQAAEGAHWIDAIGGLDEPFALTMGFTDTLVFEAARRDGCRVILDGMAGDLLFYSPARSLHHVVANSMVGQIPAVLAAYRRHGKGSGIPGLVWKSLRRLAPQMALARYRSLRNRQKLSGASSNTLPGNLLYFLRPEIAKRFLETREGARHTSRTRAPLDQDQATHAQDFKTGTISFAHEVGGQIALPMGVEPRSPFSDRRVLEFAIRMPLEAKLAAPWYKNLLRICMKDILPLEVRGRTTMGGHPGWRFFERLISDCARRAPALWTVASLDDKLNKWIDGDRLKRALAEYQRSGDYSTGYNLFLLVILAHWLDTRPGRFCSVD